MAFFESTNKFLEALPDNSKRLSFLKTNFLLSKVRSLEMKELGNFRVGCIFLAVISGSLAYYSYRQAYSQRMLSSHAYYRMTYLPPIDAGNQFWWNSKYKYGYQKFTYYYRMPKKEFNIKYRMRAAYIEGEFDHNKEVLIPQKKDGRPGYQVVTPFYYYDHEKEGYFLDVLQDGKLNRGLDRQRGAIAVVRGWIPAHLKDRRLRPNDINTGKVETLHGTIKLSPYKKSDFTAPNDPTKHYFNNLGLEDLAIYWKLPNIPDAKYCYFQEVDFGRIGSQKN